MLALVLVAIPVLFFMLTWVIVTAYRICFPEEALPIERDPLRVRHRATAAGISIPVGAREIREDQKRYQRQLATRAYHYEEGDLRIGLPEAWMDDLWLRRN